jgi:hypothetical protein
MAAGLYSPFSRLPIYVVSWLAWLPSVGPHQLLDAPSHGRRDPSADGLSGQRAWLQHGLLHDLCGGIGADRLRARPVPRARSTTPNSAEVSLAACSPSKRIRAATTSSTLARMRQRTHGLLAFVRRPSSRSSASRSSSPAARERGLGAEGHPHACRDDVREPSSGASLYDLMVWHDGLDRIQIEAVIEFVARNQADTPPATTAVDS